MSKPLRQLIKHQHAEDISNPSSNTVFSEVMNLHLSRRRLLQGSGALGAAALLPFGLHSAPAATHGVRARRITANTPMGVTGSARAPPSRPSPKTTVE